MSGAAIKSWWVWYDHPGADPKSFDTKDEALAWQADPKGTPGLGRKWVMRVAFKPPGMVAENYAQVWTNDAAELFPGPETRDETVARLRQESIETGIALIASARSDETRDRNIAKLLAEQPELTQEQVVQRVADLKKLKESRKRGPRKDKEAKPHS